MGRPIKIVEYEWNCDGLFCSEKRSFFLNDDLFSNLNMHRYMSLDMYDSKETSKQVHVRLNSSEVCLHLFGTYSEQSRCLK